LLRRQRGLGWFCHPERVFYFTRVVMLLEKETGRLHALSLLTNHTGTYTEALPQLSVT